MALKIPSLHSSHFFFDLIDACEDSSLEDDEDYWKSLISYSIGEKEKLSLHVIKPKTWKAI